MRPLFILITLFLLCGCKSIKYVPIESNLNIRDSIILRDSTILKDSTVLKDSIILKDSTVLVVDEKGNVIRSELYRYKEVYHDLQIKYNRLVDKYNSLLTEKNRVVKVPYPVERELTKWEQIKMDVGGYAIVCGLFLFILIICVYVYKVRHRNRHLH